MDERRVAEDKESGPLVWALLGSKAGDNAQTLAFCRALGFRFEEKRLEMQRCSFPPYRLMGASMRHLSPASRQVIVPPWPDAVVASGKRSVPVVRYIRKWSGGRTRLFHLGRPRAPLGWFDLLISTPQYGLPPADNVHHLLLPFPTQGEEGLQRARESWVDRLPPSRRRLAVLVGGNATPWIFDLPAIERLATSVIHLAHDLDATLLVTCGRRLSVEAREGLQRNLGNACALFHHAGMDGPNPYLGFLALADAFVVTMDSVSMVAEALDTGKDVFLFNPTYAPKLKRRVKATLSRAVRAILPVPLYQAIVRSGLMFPQRDTASLMERLVREGLARELEASGKIAPRLREHPLLGDRSLGLIERARSLIKNPQETSGKRQ